MQTFLQCKTESQHTLHPSVPRTTAAVQFTASEARGSGSPSWLLIESFQQRNKRRVPLCVVAPASIAAPSALHSHQTSRAPPPTGPSPLGCLCAHFVPRAPHQFPVFLVTPLICESLTGVYLIPEHAGTGQIALFLMCSETLTHSENTAFVT